MAGNERSEYRPRRARSADEEPAAQSETPAAPRDDAPQGDPPQDDPPQDGAVEDDAEDTSIRRSATGGQPRVADEPRQSRSQRQHQPTTEERIAASRRAERLAELRQLRDATTPVRLEKADRPDVGHRRNAAEPVRRNRHGRGRLIGGGIAVLLVAALVVGYLVVNSRRGAPAAETPASSPTAAIDTSVVSSRTMLSPELAGSVIDQAWQISADQPAGTQSSPVPACLAGPDDDAPAPSETMVRTLTTSKNGPTALHLAQAYKSAEVASEAFALIAKSLGECNLKGSYIESARVITGVGDQATGVLLDDPVKDSHRAVVANRTGRLVNVIDVAETKDTPDIDKTAEALGQLTDQQCTLAIGLCASLPKITDGPPPVAGDQPGFLALADLPVPTSGRGTWGGLTPGSPDDIVTSGCENVDFSDLSADNRTARSYVLTDNPKGMPKTFGLDEIALTMKSEKDAADEAKQIAKNIKTCDDRLPTASISESADVSGTGAGGTKISGSTALVTQKVTDDETSTYRVGIVAAGSKLVYTFLPRTKDWDLTKDQWQTVTVRAAERATQVR